MKKLASTLILSCIIGVLSFSQNQKTLLDQAYNEQSTTLLEKFFENWNKEVGSNADITAKDPLLNDANNIFCQAYDPFNLSRITGFSFLDSLYIRCKYVVIQNNLKINILHTDTIKQQTFGLRDSITKTTEISDFKPKLFFENAKPVYLTAQYKGLINGILQNPSVAGKKASGLDFINRVTRIVYNASKKQYFIESQPYVKSINFNRKQNMARVDFLLENQGGSEYFIKENGVWKMIWSGLTTKE